MLPEFLIMSANAPAGLKPIIAVAATSANDLINVCMELPPLTRGAWDWRPSRRVSRPV